jgi:DNA-binding response OmpR family regulator
MDELKHKIILVVDDEESIRDLLAIKLKPHYGEVLSAENGSKALDILKDKRVDLVITDLNMPVMDGLTLLKNISEKYPTVISIVLTGFGDKDKAVDALKFHAFDFLEKPFNDRNLLQTINSGLAAKPTPQTEVPSEVFEIIESAEKAIANIDDFVTKRQNVVKAIHAAHEELTNIYNSLPLSIIVSDTNSKIVKINNHFALSFNLKEGDIIGFSKHEILLVLFSDYKTIDDKNLMEKPCGRKVKDSHNKEYLLTSALMKDDTLSTIGTIDLVMKLP